MAFHLFLLRISCSLAFFSFALAEQFSVTNEQEELFEEMDSESVIKKKEEDLPTTHSSVALPQKEGLQKSSSEYLTPSEPKKIKPHYAGVRKPQPRVRRKKSTKIKNQWFSSKTHPKAEKKTAVSEEIPEEEVTITELPPDRPFYIRKAQLTAQNNRTNVRQPSDSDRYLPLQDQEEKTIYPKTGFQAPKGHLYLTAEYLLWRTRQEGMEFAAAKRITFGFSSGFRAGMGVHMPYDGWDIYVNYTRFTPDGSRHSHGSFYPLFLFRGAGVYQGSAVTEAHAQWEIEFQNVDVEIGRAYSIAQTLSFRPFLGLKGAWIDQHARIRYAGGFIPGGQIFCTHLENDFKGAGPLLGVESNWFIGAGFSVFGDLASALVVGHFDNEQKQDQLNGAEVVHLDTGFNLVSPFVQLIAGLAWDRNFNRDRCHVGFSIGFETQYWWSQNQVEQFTDSDLPIYIREKGDLAFYGLTLRSRFDF